MMNRNRAKSRQACKRHNWTPAPELGTTICKCCGHRGKRGAF